MDRYEELFEISKLLLAEDDAERAPEILLRRIVERCGAETGFVVVREDGSYQQKFEVGDERGRRNDLERRFSRTLVREAIATGSLLYLPNLIDDPRFASGESGLIIGRCCVLVAPLRHDGEVYGVVYLENRERVDSFTAESRAFLAELAEVAGLFLKRASDREELRRRNRSLERDLFAQHDFAGIVTRDPRVMELLQDVLQGDNRPLGVEALRGLSIAMARLHCATVGGEAAYEAMRRSLPEPDGLDRQAEALRWLDTEPQLLSWFAALGCSAPTGWDACRRCDREDLRGPPCRRR